MYKRVLIKIGTSLITDDNGIKKEFLKSIVKQIVKLYKNGIEVLIVSSGAIGAGKMRLNIKKQFLSLSEKQAIAAVGQIVLMQEYKNIFKKNNIKIAQILLDHDDVKHKEKNTNARNTISKLLEWKVIPIINENDTVATEEIKFGDNDTLAGIVASMLNVDLVIILTSVDGVYDKNPLKYKNAKFLEKIDNIDELINKNKELFKGKSDLGTGGMITKLEVAKNLNLIGIPVIITNGNKKDILINIILKNKIQGTFIQKKDIKIDAKKRWILLTLKSKGYIKIDEGAKKAIIEKGKSLLSAGIKECKGNFNFGDAVDILDIQGEKIGKGIINYSWEDLEKIKGKKTNEIKAILKNKFYEEVIHRDNMFIYRK